MEHITLTKPELRQLLTEAAYQGGQKVFDDLKMYLISEAATVTGISYFKLRKLGLEGKIKIIDGRISGKDIRKYTSGGVD